MLIDASQGKVDVSIRTFGFWHLEWLVRLLHNFPSIVKITEYNFAWVGKVDSKRFWTNVAMCVIEIVQLLQAVEDLDHDVIGGCVTQPVKTTF